MDSVTTITLTCRGIDDDTRRAALGASRAFRCNAITSYFALPTFLTSWKLVSLTVDRSRHPTVRKEDITEIEDMSELVRAV